MRLAGRRVVSDRKGVDAWTLVIASVVVTWAVLRLVGAERQVRVRRLEIHIDIERAEAARKADRAARGLS